MNSVPLVALHFVSPGNLTSCTLTCVLGLTREGKVRAWEELCRTESPTATGVHIPTAPQQPAFGPLLPGWVFHNWKLRSSKVQCLAGAGRRQIIRSDGLLCKLLCTDVSSPCRTSCSGLFIPFCVLNLTGLSWYTVFCEYLEKVHPPILGHQEF